MEKVTYAELHVLYSLPNIIRNLKSRRLRGAGHIAYIEQFRNAHRDLARNSEGKRQWSSRRRWENNIKMGLREVGCDARDWISLAKDRDIRSEMDLQVL